MKLKISQNECKFCKKTFSTERTLSVHKCVKKQRYLDKDTVGSKLGFRVYQRFYELSTVTKNPKSFLDFIDSKYYLSFIKFGRHLVDLNPVDTNSFVDYVIMEGVRLDDWCKDKVYYAFLKKFIENESVDRALERTILEMENWCNINNTQLVDFFSDIGTIEATFLIRSGKISPWVLYISNTSSNLLNQMTTEQGNMLKEVIDPLFWADIFSKKTNDVQFAKQVLEAAKL